MIVASILICLILSLLGYCAVLDEHAQDKIKFMKLNKYIFYAGLVGTMFLIIIILSIFASAAIQ